MLELILGTSMARCHARTALRLPRSENTWGQQGVTEIKIPRSAVPFGPTGAGASTG